MNGLVFRLSGIDGSPVFGGVGGNVASSGGDTENQASFSEFYGAPGQDFSGFWGRVKFFITGGIIDGFQYNIEGEATGLAPITGMAPTPGKPSKFSLQLSRQLAKDGPKSILKSYKTIQRRLIEHQNKLSNLKYKSSVEREIRTFQKQLKILKDFIKQNGL